MIPSRGDFMSEVMPDVLVVVPTLGQRLDSLAESLESITSQEGVRTRIVVVAPEDASTGSRARRARGCRLVDDPRRGLSAAVNAGLAAHKDETYYSWLNDDDFYAPGGRGPARGHARVRL